MAVLYAVTDNGLARLAPGQGEWTASMVLEDPAAQCVALDPKRPDTLYAGSRATGIWKSDDGGATWRSPAEPHAEIYSLAVSPADGRVYAGCEPSMIFVSEDDGKTWRELDALRRIPSAPTWSFPPRPWTSHVRWIAPSPHDADLLLAGIELGGLMRTTDGGETWEDHRPGAQKDVHALAWHPTAPGRAYEAAGGGTAWSHDSGATWHSADTGLDRHYTWALAVDPDDANTWFVSASPGPGAAHYSDDARALVYRWQNGGPWDPLHGGLPTPLDSMPYALAMVDGTLYAGLADGRLFHTHDRGETWEPLSVHGVPLSGLRALAG